MTWLSLILIFGILSVLSFCKAISRKNFVRLTYIFLIVFALFYEPSQSADMYRFREALIYIKVNGAAAAYRDLWYIYENSQLFFKIMVLLSRIPTFLFFPICLMSTYGLALAIFFDATKDAELSQYQFGIVFSFFVCCVNFGIVFSIVRFFMAYFWGVLGIYIWFKPGVKKWIKILSVLLIVSSTFIHTAGFMVPLIWILSMLLQIKGLRVFAVLIPFSMSYFEQITQFAGKIFGGASLYGVITDKFYSYAGNNYADMTSRARLFYYQILAVIVIIFLITKLLKRENAQHRSFNSFYMILLLISVAFIPNNTLFFRMIQVTLTMSPIYMALNVRSFSKSQFTQLIVVVECMTMLFFYGRLSTYYYL